VVGVIKNLLHAGSDGCRINVGISIACFKRFFQTLRHESNVAIVCRIEKEFTAVALAIPVGNGDSYAGSTGNAGKILGHNASARYDYADQAG
jgi:hypothetical protein